MKRIRHLKMKLKKTLEDGKTSMFTNGKSNIMKVAAFPTAIYRFSAIPIKVPVTLFTGIRESNPKIHMEIQKTPSNQSNPELKE
jgi:hypothetical protein